MMEQDPKYFEIAKDRLAKTYTNESEMVLDFAMGSR